MELTPFFSFALLFWSLLILTAQAGENRHPSIPGSWEPDLVNQEFPTGLTEAELKSMPLDDPKLRVAYKFLIGSARGGPMIINSSNLEMTAALNDLRRRGDAATPLLLDMMDKNRHTLLERLIPFVVARIDSIKMGPFVDYLRRMVETRPMEIDSSEYQVIAEIIFDHGNSSDIKIVKGLVARRADLAPSLQAAYELQRRKVPVKQ